MFDFDTPISRIDTHAEKYSLLKLLYGRDDILPFWVADMEFGVAPQVTKALAERISHPIYGYSSIPESLKEAVISWNKERYGVNVAGDALILVPGVMSGVSAALLALSDPGDAIILQTPLYPPLMKTVIKNRRQLIENRLILKGDRYVMNFDELESLFRQHQPKMFILCTPHNPVGRVWRREELTRLIELTLKYKVYLVSDEIHADIVFPPHEHISALSLDPDISSRIIVLNSASKSFNVAGLNTAYALIPDLQLRTAFRKQLRRMNLHGVNLFGMTALEAAYSNGKEWLDELLHYLLKNREYMTDTFNKELPVLKHYVPEGTYLYWLDFNPLGFSAREISEKLINTARVGLNEGSTFSRFHEGFWRFNFAVPRSMLEEGVERIVQAFQ